MLHREPPTFTTIAGRASGGAAHPIGPPVMRAACFSALVYIGWILLAGLFRPSPDWLAGRPGSPVSLLLYYLCLDGFALALSAAFLSALDGERFRALGLWFFPGWWRQAAVGLVAGGTTISLVALLVAGWRSAESLAGLRSFSRLPGALVFLLLAATFEELMFRGYAWQRLAGSLGAVSASLISSLLFGLAHAANPQATLLSTGNTVLAGMLMCVVRARSRALWMPLGLHFGWNLFLGPVFRYPVSGYRLTGGESAVSPAALDWLTGGKYGLEGSVVLTIAATAAIFVLLRCPRKWLSPIDFQE